MSDMNTREQVLEAAIKMVNGGREQDYGSVENNFARIANFWTAYLQNRGFPSLILTGTDVALMMVMFKMARLQATPVHRDSWVDMAGYAACGAGLNLSDPPARERTER